MSNLEGEAVPNVRVMQFTNCKAEPYPIQYYLSHARWLVYEL